jgi:hypothetical protein
MLSKKPSLFSKLLLLLISTLIGTSCTFYEYKSKAPDEFEKIRLHADVKPGISTRKELQESLGKPFIDNKRWNVAVYRVNAGHDVMFGGPILPVIPDPPEKIITYALVTYDIDGVVKDIDWGIYHENEYTATLEASGFIFTSHNVRIHFPHTEILLAPLPDSQRSLLMRDMSGDCSLFITPQDVSGFAADSYYQKIYVDDKSLVDQAVAGYLGFFKIPLPAGEHKLTIKIPMGVFSKTLYFRRTFSCREGDLLYATRQIRVTDSGNFWDWNKISLQGEVTVSDSPAEMFKGMRQILFYAGKWFD